MEEINILDILKYLKKKINVICVSSLIFLIIGIIFTNYIQVPKYKSETTLLLSLKNKESNVYNQNELALNQNLIATYTEIVKSKKVLNQVIDDLDLKLTIEELTKMISVTSEKNTLLITIAVSSLNKNQSMMIANHTAKIFIKEIETLLSLENIGIIDKATVADEAYNVKPAQQIILSTTVGMALSIVILLVFYVLDTTVKNEEQIEKETSLPVIGAIPKNKNRTKVQKDLFVFNYPKSRLSESIKSIKTNLQFSSIDKDIKTLLITSSMPGEGKSFVASNLATTFASSKARVLLIDCDLRRGRQHQIFDAINHMGLSNLLIDDVKNYRKYIKDTGIKHIKIITAGTVPPNPSELLGSQKYKKLIEMLRNEFDVIILDCPPVNGLADTLEISALADSVIIVCAQNKTKMALLNETKRVLNQINTKVTGVIMNKVDLKNSKTYEGYYD